MRKAAGLSPAPARQNFVSNAVASVALPPASAVASSHVKNASVKFSNTPTHSAFAEQTSSPAPSGYGMAGMPRGLGARPGQAAMPAPATGQEPQLRDGALYGALEALQAGCRALSDPEEADMGNNRKPKAAAAPAKAGQKAQTPEEVWQSLPSGGEAAWKSSQPRQPLRLRVARLQEALSEAAAGLQKAKDACRGGGEDDLAPENLGAASLGPPGVAAAIRNECTVLEAETKELKEEKEFLDARVVEVKAELARLKEQLAQNPGSPTSPPARPSRKAIPEPAPVKEEPAPKAEDVSELAVVLRLLACLKDVALSNRRAVLPEDPSKWTREQQVVAYFLDEVEACQTRIDM